MLDRTERRALHSEISPAEEEALQIMSTFSSENKISTGVEFDPAEVTRLICCTFPFTKPSACLIASMLGTSVRSFQRALAAEGTTYRRLLEAARKKAAAEALEKGIDVTEIAFLLGYDHCQNFSAAYKVWYGRPPSSVRP